MSETKPIDMDEIDEVLHADMDSAMAVLYAAARRYCVEYEGVSTIGPSRTGMSAVRLVEAGRRFSETTKRLGDFRDADVSLERMKR